MDNGFINRGGGVTSNSEISNGILTNRKIIKDVPGTTYTLLESDNNKVLVFSNASGCTILFNTLTAGFLCDFIQKTSSGLSFSAGTAILEFISSSSGGTDLQYSKVSIFYRSTAAVNISGNLTVI